MNRHSEAIVVFGEALIDDFGSQQLVGGAPFNVARNLAGFGLRPLIITRIGRDANGKQVLAEFDRFGMSVDGLQIDQVMPTGRVLVERVDGQPGYTIVPNQAYDYIGSGQAVAAASGVRHAVVYFGTLAQRGLVSRSAVRDVLLASDARRYLDLNLREGQVSERCVFESMKRADIVKVNEVELQALFGFYTHTRHDTAHMDNLELRMACATLLRTFELEGLIVTLGARGAVYFGADGTVVADYVSAAPQAVIDTVGAGDAFSAVFLYGQAQGWSVRQRLERGNAFAGAICGIAGAVPQDLAFYAPWLTRWQAG